MAEAAGDSRLCLLCSKEPLEPLTLGCDHRFCDRCLRDCWAPSLTGDCPQCNRRSSKLLPPMFSLEKDPSLSQEESSGLKREEEKKLPEQSPISLSERPGPTEGAASEEEWPQDYLHKLKKQKALTENIMMQYKSVLEHTDAQALQCEDHIRAQFRRFQEFLLTEEESHVSALRKEHKEKKKIIKEELKQLKEKVCSLSDTICSAEQQLQEQSSESSSLRENMESLGLTDEPVPQLKPGLLIDRASLLGNLGNRVWRQMNTIVNASPVILDPNTAHRWLHVSEDLTRVRQRDGPDLQLPLNPERFSHYSSILGSQGFSRGVHGWSVEVGDISYWVIGVAKESANRTTMCDSLPKDGFWCLSYRNNEYSDVEGNTVELSVPLRTVRVVLEFDTGCISFYDAKNYSLICTYSEIFTEKVYPYFSVGQASDPYITKDMRICPFNPPLSSLTPASKQQTSQMVRKKTFGTVKKHTSLTTTKTKVPSSLSFLKSFSSARNVSLENVASPELPSKTLTSAARKAFDFSQRQRTGKTKTPEMSEQK